MTYVNWHSNTKQPHLCGGPTLPPKQPIVPFSIWTKDLCVSPLVFGTWCLWSGGGYVLSVAVYLACDKGIILLSTVTLPQILRGIRLSLHEFKTVPLLICHVTGGSSWAVIDCISSLRIFDVLAGFPTQALSSCPWSLCKFTVQVTGSNF